MEWCLPVAKHLLICLPLPLLPFLVHFTIRTLHEGDRREHPAAQRNSASLAWMYSWQVDGLRGGWHHQTPKAAQHKPPHLHARDRSTGLQLGSATKTNREHENKELESLEWPRIISSPQRKGKYVESKEGKTEGPNKMIPKVVGREKEITR